MHMATESSQRNFRRLLFFSLGGICVGLAIAALTALLISILAPSRTDNWQIDDDNLVITFHLREGSKWSDGTPITADNVVFTYNTDVLNEDVDSNSSNGQLLPDDTYPVCEKVDDYTVKFTMSTVHRPVMNEMGFNIMPKHELAKYVQDLDPSIQVVTFDVTWKAE